MLRNNPEFRANSASITAAVNKCLTNIAYCVFRKYETFILYALFATNLVSFDGKISGHGPNRASKKSAVEELFSRIFYTGGISDNYVR